MAGNQTVASSAIVDSRPPPQPVGDAPRDHGTMAMQAGGCSARVQYVRATDLPSTHSAGNGHIGPWEKILSFFGIRKPAPLPDRPPIADRQPGPDKALAEHRVEAAPVKDNSPPAAETKPATPFPILKLPHELLCEVMARVPAGDRHFVRTNAPLATTCKAFHAAIDAVSVMAEHRDDDAVARRIAGMKWSHQVEPMIDALVHAKAPTREWALPAVIRMTCGMSVSGRHKMVMAVLARAKERSALWALELTRHFARWLPDTDSDLLTELANRVIAHDAENSDERLAKARALAQLAQRISPNDIPGTVRRWESIYKAVSDNPCPEDILTVDALTFGFDHLRDTFKCKFNVDSSGMLVCKLIWLSRAVASVESKQYMAACTADELLPRKPPKPLPGTVAPHDPLRAFSSIMARPISRIDPLPSHFM